MTSDMVSGGVPSGDREVPEEECTPAWGTREKSVRPLVIGY